MTDDRRSSHAEDVLRIWKSAGVPVESAERTEARRVPTIFAIDHALRDAARSSQRRRLWRRTAVIACAAAALLFAGGATWRTFAGHERERVADNVGLRSVSGGVVVTHGGRSLVASPNAAPLELSNGDQIETLIGGHAELRTQRSSIQISSETRVAIAANKAEERLRLAMGRVQLSVDRTINVPRLVVVQTPNAEVIVRGTMFRVDVTPSSHGGTATEVTVTRGSVRIVQAGAEKALLHAGERWSSDSGTMHGTAGASHETRDGIASPRDEAQGEIGASPAHAGAAGFERAPGMPRHSGAQARSSEAPRISSDGSEAAVPAGTLAEENRMFQQALDARNRGNDAAAAELFSRLLGHYPHSPLVEQAKVERFRALERLGQHARAANEARRYLAEHAHGFARDEARDIVLGGSP